MTNSGFYSSIYQLIREYAELVDSVLISLKKDPNNNDPNKEKLALLLEDLTQRTSDDLSMRIISIMLGEEGNDSQHWGDLSEALRASRPSPTLIEDLENFALLLEQQQADALEKMRGLFS